MDNVYYSLKKSENSHLHFLYRQYGLRLLSKSFDESPEVWFRSYSGECKSICSQETTPNVLWMTLNR